MRVGTRIATHKGLSPLSAEVHEIDRARPPPTPGPPHRLERGDRGPALQRHAGPHPASVEVGRGELRPHQVALDVGVVERVEVDGQPVGMGRPVRLATGLAADEGLGVVAVPGRGQVQRGFRRYPHLLKGKAGCEQSLEDIHHGLGDIGVHQHLAGMRAGIEAAEGHGEVAQLAGLHRTGRFPAAAGQHPRGHRADRRDERGRSGWGQLIDRGESPIHQRWGGGAHHAEPVRTQR